MTLGVAQPREDARGQPTDAKSGANPLHKRRRDSSAHLTGLCLMLAVALLHVEWKFLTGLYRHR
jgi:hypothetical protein